MGRRGALTPGAVAFAALASSLAALAALASLVALAAGCRRTAPSGAAALPYAVGQQLQSALEGRRLQVAAGDQAARQTAGREMRASYRRRLFLPVWSDAGGPLARADELVRAIGTVAGEGLDPGRYQGERLAAMIRGTQENWRRATTPEPLLEPRLQHELVVLDLRLSYAFFNLAADEATGRVPPRALGDWYTRPRQVSPQVVLEQVVRGAPGGDTSGGSGAGSSGKGAGGPDADAPIGPDAGGPIGHAVLALAPPAPEYARLRQALAAYRQLGGRGGWRQLPPGPALGPGARGPRVAALRERLTAGGDLPASSAGAAGAAKAASQASSAGSTNPPSPTGSTSPPSPAGPASPEGGRPDDRYDAELAAAVARFQARHGLEASGRLDGETQAELDVPLAVRIRQLELNMERWRWMPGDLGQRYILVNVPDFRLQVVEDGQVRLAMRVIVGKEQSKTPVFSGEMTFLVLNPSWHLPDSIVAHEIVPKLAADPGYLAKHHMDLVKSTAESAPAVTPAMVGASELQTLGTKQSPYRLRQAPGADNPLGRIKFMFPNRFDVYLHDTPSGQLFDRSERDFSHGCIRLEKPDELAAYVLRGEPRWTPQAFAAALETGRTQTVTLPRPIPVHILYWTAWADRDGTVQFRRDLYGHDADLDRSLAQAPPVWLELGAAVARRHR